MLHSPCHRWLVLAALAALTCASGRIVAGGPAKTDTDGVVLPKPADVQKLEVYPAKIALKGGDDAQQLILTAMLDRGRLQDLTGDCKYEIGDAKVARVTTTGRVIPLSN